MVQDFNNIILDPEVFELCDQALQQRIEQPPVFPISTRLELSKEVRSGEVGVDRTPPKYPAMWKDFYGLPSGPICIFNTGPAWPLLACTTGGWDYLRELRPVH